MAKLHFIPSNNVSMTNEVIELANISQCNDYIMLLTCRRFEDTSLNPLKFWYVVPLLYNANSGSYDCIQRADLRSNLRFLRINIPQIVWRIEHWLNII
eukprot:463709_1